jgi:hypothetical protein
VTIKNLQYGGTCDYNQSCTDLLIGANGPTTTNHTIERGGIVELVMGIIIGAAGVIAASLAAVAWLYFIAGADETDSRLTDLWSDHHDR